MADGLIGRSRELDALVTAIGQVRSGQGAHVHLCGNPGMGKTTLLAASAARLGGQPLWATADETDRRRPYAIAGALFGSAVVAARDPIGAAIGAAELAAQASCPAVICDDLHWADDGSLDVLAALSRRVGQLGLLMVTAARRHPMPDGLRRLAASARQAGTLLELDPMEPDEVGALVQRRAGGRPGPHLEALLERAGGNPFLLGELLDGLLAAGDLVLDGTQVELSGGAAMPGELATALVERIAVLVPGGVTVATAAAALPAGFSVDELAAVADEGPTDVHGIAEALLAAGVLVARPDGLGYRHELLRDAVRLATPTSLFAAFSRRALHAVGASDTSAERFATCLLAVLDPREPAACERLLDTARRLAPAQPTAAADLFAHALSGIDRRDPANRDVTVELGWAMVAAGRAAEVADLVADRCPADDDVEIDRVVGHALTISGRLADVQRRFAHRTAGDIEARGDLGDARFVDGVAELAQLRLALGETASARRLLEWVGESPTEPSAVRRVAVHTTRSYLHGVAGEFDLSIEHGRLARLAAAEDGDGLAQAVSATLSMALSLDLNGAPGDALALVRRPDLPGVQARWAAPLLQFAAAITLYRQGAWDDALAEAGAGLTAAEEADLGLGSFWPHAVHVLILRARGDIAGADRWLARTSELEGPRPLGVEWLLLATATSQWDRGETDAAADTLQLLTGGVLAAGAPALLLASGPLAVLAFVAAGRDGAADRVVAALGGLRAASRSPVVAAVACWTAALREGDVGGLAAAAAALHAAGRQADAALAHHDAAVTAIRHGNPIEARAHAARAFAGFDDLGADHWHRRLRGELRRYGLELRPRRGPRRAAFGWGAITPSERAVIDAVAEGRTNTEIGERLFVSRRTVESHLGRIFTKLGCTNRNQLAAMRRAAEAVGGSGPAE